ncbi:DUF362 domain-containing protein [candidate division KSB1 bacterium]
MTDKKSKEKKAVINPIVYFADIAVENLEQKKTLPDKFRRMLGRFKLREKVDGKKVAIKMHFGSGIGYTTIHPVFIRILVEELKKAGAIQIAVMDRRPEDGVARGYTPEVLGCNVISAFGETGSYLYKEKVGFKELDYAFFGGETVDCDYFIDLSHIKGHGSCGFGGAMKNIAMGVVPDKTRMKLHHLEGGISYDPEKCDMCKKCIESCPNDAIWLKGSKKDKRINMFHNCTYCQHCILICPNHALDVDDRKFTDFSKGMARVTKAFLKKFDPENLLFINFLLDITIFCDCWGFSTASLVPDIGIVASQDMVAAETASLDMIKTENLLPNGMPKNHELLEGDGHLFERIHAKDPYHMLHELEKIYDCSTKYELKEVK